MSNDFTLIGAVALVCGSAAVALLITPAVRRFALLCGAVDVPDERKIHLHPVPRLGGLAVAAAVAIALGTALALNPELRGDSVRELGAGRSAALLISVLLVAGVGALDDIRRLSASGKLLVEVVAAALAVAALTPITIAVSPFDVSLQGILAPLVAVFWIVAITNAVNMMDVVDGVAGGVSAVAAAWLAAISFAMGQTGPGLILLALAGALIGFLPHNFRHRRTFLGDSGSLPLGFILATACVLVLRRGDAWLIAPSLLVLALPVAEVGLTVLRRTLRGLAVTRNHDGLSERFVLSRGRLGLFTPDRRHVPHRLLELGMSQPGAVTALYLVAIAAGALAYATVRWSWSAPLSDLLAIAAIVYFAPRWLYRELRLLERGALLPFLDSPLVRSPYLQALYDAAVLAAGYLAAEAALHGPSIFSEGGALWARAGVLAAVGLLGFWLAGLYRVSYRHAGIAEALRATRAVFLGVALAIGALVVLFPNYVTVALWLLHLFLVFTAVVGARVSFRVLDHMHQKGHEAARRVLVFGAGRGGDLAVREIRSNPALGLEAVGFADDDPRKWGRRFHDLSVHEGHELELLLRDLRVDDVIVSTAKLAPSRLQSLAEVCAGGGVRLLSFDLHWGELDGNGAEPSLAYSKGNGGWTHEP